MAQRKLIYNYEGGWDDCAMVILKKAIKDAKKFTGKVSFKKSEKDMKELFKKNTYQQPDRIGITIPYRKDERGEDSVDIKIELTWSGEFDKCAVHLVFPKTDEYYHETSSRGWKRRPKYKHSNTVERVLSKIQDAIRLGKESIDETIAEDIKEKLDAKEKRDDCRGLAEELGVELKEGYYGERSYEYEPVKDFALSFKLAGDEEDDDDDDVEKLYKLTGAYAVLDFDELQQIIKIIGGNPRAIAAKLLNSK